MGYWLSLALDTFMIMSTGLFWALVLIRVWEKTEERRLALQGWGMLGRQLSKLRILEADLVKLRAQIQRDFPGEIEVYHPYDYGEQHVIATAGVLLLRYHNASASHRTPKGAAADVEGVKIAKV